MQKNRWSRKFDWVTNDSGVTYFQKDRSIIYEEDRFIAVGDIYFKLNKYLTGVTFTYINSLEDIYKIDLLTGDGYSLVNMYNEYDVIDRTMKNITHVDVASDVNINIRSQWKEINSVILKPGHLVLLKNQNNTIENDIYLVDNNYYLVNSGILSSREKSDKFSCSVKLGKNADKQYFLNTGITSDGVTFPIYYEPKTFIEGQSYLLKHLINYNIYNTFTGSTMSGTTTSKIIFTDYDVARKQLSGNYDFYEDFKISVVINSIPSNFITINYHNDSYSIRYGTEDDYLCSGNTTNILTDGDTTSIPYTPDFDVMIGDYLEINMFSGTTINLTMNSYVKDVDTINNVCYLEDVIPNRVLSDLYYTNFTVENLSIASDWSDAISKIKNNPYSEFFDVSYTESMGIFYNIVVSPKESIFNKYFDYDGLTFNITDNNDFRFFETNNQYIKYNLYDRLNQINESVFNTGFTFYNEYLLNSIDGYRYIDSDTVKVFTDVDDLQDKFKPHTYVYVTDNSGLTSTTLVLEVNDYEIIIERPKNWTRYPVQRQEPPITSIQNIDGLKNISDILYELYMNDEYDGHWYYERSDNEIKNICKIYAELLTLNNDFRDNVTGILYQNDNNEFILKLYDIINDHNLFYEPIELIFVGSDRITRLPVPFTFEGDSTTTTTTIREPIIPGVIPTTTTTTTLTPTTTTTTTTIAPTTTTTTTMVPSCELLGMIDCFSSTCVMEGYVNCNYIPTTTTTTTVSACVINGFIECSLTTTTTTTMTPTTTTTTTMTPTTTTTTMAPTTTTSTTLGPTTTTTITTMYLADIYYGVSSNAIVSESEILSTFHTLPGYVGEPTGRKYVFENGYYYKYWAIRDYPNVGYRVINKITNLENHVNLAYNQTYRYYQEDPYPDEQQSITYGKITINGIVYRIYRTISKSSLQIECYVYSID